MKATLKEVADKWKGVGGSTSKCNVAVAVVWAESKGNPKNNNTLYFIFVL